ncbi:MAG: hypothetical protein IPJ65_19430 [Archangiaceae bacterium]|nr:hypothetical protein [Archangiaceae bacterium]
MWALLAGVREQVARHLAWVDDDLRQSAVMVASELVENAVKYGGRPASLKVVVDDHTVCVEVRSQVSSESAARETVARVEAIRAAPDRHALYLERMRALLGAPPGGSMQLGLLRICGEGEFDLACHLEQNQLHLIATRELS